MSVSVKFPISLIIGSVILSCAFIPAAHAQNLSQLQLSISSQVQAIPDPPPPTGAPLNAVPFTFDPFHTYLVQSGWENGIGCPTGATTSDGTTSTPYTDSACPTGDPKDSFNQGLSLVKTGPTTNFAAAGARLVGPGVKGVVLTQLGYDIRKPGANIGDPRGSHCGAGAPRFNISSGGHLFFIGCASPPPDMDVAGMAGSAFAGARVRRALCLRLALMVDVRWSIHARLRDRSTQYPSFSMKGRIPPEDPIKPASQSSTTS